MKKIIALLACLTLLLSMAACGSADTTEPTTEPTTEATEPTTEATEPTTGEIVETPDEPATTEGTVGQTLLATFKANATGTAEEIANAVISDPTIPFMGMAMAINPVDFEFLSGLGEAKIEYKEGATFGPMIGTIPFIGYIFVLEEGTDVEAFKTTLEENANLRWNICTAAEELVIDNEGNTVFFLMCPTTFEQPEEEGGDIGGMDMLPEEGEGIVLG